MQLKTGKMLNMIGAGIKRAMFGRRFIISVFAAALFAILDCFPLFFYNRSFTVVNLLITASGGTMFWTMAFVIAAIPYSCAFHDDIGNNTLTSLLLRGGSRIYSISTVIGCFVSSFACMFLGYVICLAAYLPFTKLWDGREMDSYGNEFITLGKGQYMLFIITAVLFKSLESTFFAIIAMLISLYVKNKYVVLATPILTFHFVSYMAGFYLHLPKYLDPFVIYAIYGPLYELKVSEIYGVLYAFAFTVIVSFGVYIAMRRRLKKCF